jgi:hypothetical protein
MKPVPGTLQEGGARFQTTHWTVVLQAGQPEADEAAAHALAVFSEHSQCISAPQFCAGSLRCLSDGAVRFRRHIRYHSASSSRRQDIDCNYVADDFMMARHVL